MKTSVDCLACFMGQALRVARISTADEAVHLEVARVVAALLPQMEMSLTPPENSVAVYATIARVTGCPDPYLAIKKASNDQALAILPDLILVIGAQRMFGVGSRAVLGLERTVFHLVNPGHFLKDHLALLDEVAHGRNMSIC